MANHQHLRHETHPEHDESILASRMIRIMVFARVLVIKNGPGLFERNTVLPLVRTVFGFIPVEIQKAHAFNNKYNVLLKIPRKRPYYRKVERLIQDWPKDIRKHLLRLMEEATSLSKSKTA